uniref:Uncharacterized protein n=1 Tax=Anguilla anguilla TaxID=7936 RepID=A0A0E9PZ02_ANGAN
MVLDFLVFLLLNLEFCLEFSAALLQ